MQTTKVEVDLSIIRQLTYAQTIYYIFMKNYCENNDGECRLSNDEITQFIDNNTHSNSKTLAALVNKGFLGRHFEEQWNQRVITISQK